MHNVCSLILIQAVVVYVGMHYRAISSIQRIIPKDNHSSYLKLRFCVHKLKYKP